MKVLVLGLWHLGCVTAASCAKHFDVVCLEDDSANADALRAGRLPVREPDLDALFKRGLASGRLRISAPSEEACLDASVLWVTEDTPVDEDDRPDSTYVINRVRNLVPLLPAETVVLISAQLPAGSCRQLEGEFPGRAFACSPENLRLGRSILDFNEPDRIIVGCRTPEVRGVLANLFESFCANILWMSPESAEMTKHALNAFLAVSVTFANEIARVCEKTGANAHDVALGIKSDRRIGPRAYLAPGAAFAGGTLARDVTALTDLAVGFGEPLVLIPAIKPSNDRHKLWPFRKMCEQFDRLRGKAVGVLGLTYKPGTDTLRRSHAVELCELLVKEGCTVTAFDPAIKELPQSLSGVRLASDAAPVVRGADAVVICTEWREFLSLPWLELVGKTHQPFIYDANGFLRSVLDGSGVPYFSVGNC